MFSGLNASDFQYNGVFYNTEFENILLKVVLCYKHMITDNVRLPNNENLIRDHMLYNYLKKKWFKEQYGFNATYLFDAELPENAGRVDIRIVPINPFIMDEAYYIIECKRLNAENQNGRTGLNAEYISEGICRFTSEKYSCYYKTNGMIGFVVQPFDIDRNVDSINALLNKIFTYTRTVQPLTKVNIATGFDFSYYSTHTCNTGNLIIYHLMLDFSNNIK